jgi:hypothetical protein
MHRNSRLLGLGLLLVFCGECLHANEIQPTLEADLEGALNKLKVIESKLQTWRSQQISAKTRTWYSLNKTNDNFIVFGLSFKQQWRQLIKEARWSRLKWLLDHVPDERLTEHERNEKNYWLGVMAWLYQDVSGVKQAMTRMNLTPTDYRARQLSWAQFNLTSFCQQTKTDKDCAHHNKAWQAWLDGDLNDR